MSEATDNRSEDTKFDRPHAVTDAEIAFPGQVSHLMPAYTALPEEFIRERDPYSRLVNKWFFEGIRKDAVQPKAGIDARMAWRHLKAIMGSFGPSHEHKIAGVAYLMSRWFEPPQEKAS